MALTPLSSQERGWGRGKETLLDTRPSWDEYFMRIARDVATRSTCLRRHVGAVIVRERRILSTGYNGSPPGQPHCYEVGCLMEDGRCIRTLHAEQNAIIQAALQWRADLLVLGTRGGHEGGRWRYASVAADVAQQTVLPLLLVPQASGASILT